MDFYYDAVLGLVYNFQQNIVILEVGSIPNFTPKEIMEIYFTRGLVLENPSEPDKVEVGFNTYITCNLFDFNTPPPSRPPEGMYVMGCDPYKDDNGPSQGGWGFDTPISEPIKKSSYFEDTPPFDKNFINDEAGQWERPTDYRSPLIIKEAVELGMIASEAISGSFKEAHNAIVRRKFLGIDGIEILKNYEAEHKKRIDESKI